MQAGNPGCLGWGIKVSLFHSFHTVDGSEILGQLIWRISHYLQGFDTFQVVQDFFHQQ